MSFEGKSGFFGALKPTNPHYVRYALDPSYAKFVNKCARGGGAAAGTLGRAFAYTRPKFDDGGGVDFDDPIFNQQQQQPRQPGQVQGMMQAINQWGQGPSGVSQRFGNAGLYDIQRASYQLQQTVDADTADKIQKYTDKIANKVAAANPDIDTPGLAKRARGGVTGTGNNVLPRYAKKPANSPNNDPSGGFQSARGGADYSWGKVSPRFQNDGAELHPTGHNETKRRSGMTDDYLPPAMKRALESQARFAKGGKVSPATAWQDKPQHIKQRLARGGGPRIHVPHEGGLVLNIHLSNVGPHAITLGDHGGVDSSRMTAGSGSKL
jgi:hypothetical protein